ncbi:uncharacterized protein N0V89_007831 [Didymosphaeria variabile]|uniref:Uncharacterized protein n=1 Tax=Didymosphaeria variabile TaxID=1932322 RepID=A0A9W8XJL3_9PLEO|nr:uncharacterized protein N0V89_007831 [Didymosphaeria variabile]KAJ4352483.1 hypothetical protein N0V89_007831 [Didymosphaeria variabile]
MPDGNCATSKILIDVLVYYYFLAAGRLDGVPHQHQCQICLSPFFRDNFRAACAWVKNEGRKPLTKLKDMPKIVQPPWYGQHEPHDSADRHAGGDEGANSGQGSSKPLVVAANANTTEAPPSQLKPARRELDEACDLIEETNKRLKTEIEELQSDKQQWEATKKRLEDDKWTLRKDLCRERESIGTLKKELKIGYDARVAMEKRAIQAEQKVVTCGTQLEKEKAITVRALGEKARLEIELQDLKSAKRS